MAEVPSPLVVMLTQEEASLLLESPVEGSTKYLQNQLRDYLKDGKNRVALTDEQLGKVLRGMHDQVESVHTVWRLVFSRPFKALLAQVSDAPPARMA